MINPAIKVDNLSLHLNHIGVSKTILTDVSFQLKKGETLGIAGQSGCGKSMTVKAICGLLPGSNTVTGGNISINGSGNILSMDTQKRQQLCSENIALIMQDSINALNPYIKIKHQLYETYRFHNRDMDDNQISSLIAEDLQNVGLEASRAFMDSYAGILSGGMRQRVAIVLALSSKAGTVIADEPTTSLDSVHQKKFIELLENLQIKRGLSLIFITHNLSLISRLCKNVAVMYYGKIIESGAVKDVFLKPEHSYTAELIKNTKALYG